MRGIDISHWNDFNIAMKEVYDAKFVIAKASEGVSYVDETFEKNVDLTRKKGLIAGAYHYARPEKNGAEEEANHFYNTICDYIDEGLVVALDWEGKALEEPFIWALTWLKTVENLIGYKPILYIQQSQVKYARMIEQEGFELWVARYAASPGDISPFKRWRIWQHKAEGISVCIDEFNGDEEDLRKLAGFKKKLTNAPNCPIFNKIVEMIKNGEI